MVRSLNSKSWCWAFRTKESWEICTGLINDNETVSENWNFDRPSFERKFRPNLDDDGDSYRTNIAIAVGVVAFVSQMIVVLISTGLPGNFSASTFLMAQAAAEMWRRLNIIHQPLCNAFGDVVFGASTAGKVRRQKLLFSGGTFSFQAWNQYICAVVLHTRLWSNLTPDYFQLYISMDRLIALTAPVWYKQHCTKGRGWILVIPVILLSVLLCLPRAFGAELTFRCVTTSVTFDQIIFMSNIPAVILVSVLTLGLLLQMRFGRKSLTSSLTSVEKSVSFHFFRAKFHNEKIVFTLKKYKILVF